MKYLLYYDGSIFYPICMKQKIINNTIFNRLVYDGNLKRHMAAIVSTVLIVTQDITLRGHKITATLLVL